MHTPRRTFFIPIVSALLSICAWSATTVSNSDGLSDPGASRLKEVNAEKFRAEASAMLKAADKRNRDPSVRAKEHHRYINEIFDPIFEDLKLPATGRQQIKSALVERGVAIDISWNESRDGKLDDSVHELAEKKATAAALTKVRGVISESLHFKLAEMLEAGEYLSYVTTGYAPSMKLLGCPLTADQQIRLATVLRSVYDSTVNPSREARSKISVNPNGLTELDEEALRKMEAFLDMDQRAAMRSAFISSNWREEGR